MKTTRIITKCFLALLCLVLGVSCKKKVVEVSALPLSEKSVTTESQTVPVNLQLSSQIFFEKEVFPTLRLLSAGKLPYTEINDRYASGAAVIIKEYGKPISLKVKTDYHTSSKYVHATAGDRYDLDSGVIWIYVPALMDVFEEFQSSGHPRWREIFTNHCIITFMHELEHLRFKLRNQGGDRISLTEESRAWDETCVHTIAPLIEKYKVPIAMSEALIYKTWTEAGRNSQHVAWRQEIERRHMSSGAQW